MKFELTETIFTYPQELLDAWKSREKAWIPESLFVPPEVYNQPHYPLVSIMRSRNSWI